MSDVLFTKVKEDFYFCLNTEKQEDAVLAIEKLKASLLEAESHSEFAKNHSSLFIEMFQFKAISCHSVWEKTPKLYSAIGEFIHLKSSHEEMFRSQVMRRGLGKYLEMVI